MCRHEENILYFVTYLILLLTSAPSCVSACDGYSFSGVKMSPCEGFTNKIQITDYNIELTADCNLITYGCAEFKEDIESFNMTFEMSKGGVVLRQRQVKDGCKRLEMLSSTFNNVFNHTGLPSRCPIKATKICGGPEKSISIQNHKSRLGVLVGKTSGKVTVETNAGSSCYTFSSRLRHSAAQASRGFTRRRPNGAKN